MRLAELMRDLVQIESACEITGMTLDSRCVKPGFLFVALKGALQHGMQYAEAALQKGAVAIVYEADQEGNTIAQKLEGHLLIPMRNVTEKMGALAVRFYQTPSEKMDVIGVTGTNGKTSCSQYLAQILGNCGVIGTLGWGDQQQMFSTHNTTPDVISVHSMLAQLKQRGNQTVAMEVSSHGLDQGRVDNVQFKGALFNNLTRDHLDYHGTMQAYLAAKMKLMCWPGLQFAVVNRDCEYSEQVLKQLHDDVDVWGFSLQKASFGIGRQVTARNAEYFIDGTQFELCVEDQCRAVKTALVGRFNLENILAVSTVMLAMGHTFNDVTQKIMSLQPVAGRMMRFGGRDLPSIFVDYAHTPDALQKLLAGLREISGRKLTLVFGCGGDRDRGKRSEMGSIAEQWADEIVITDDNPRGEDPQQITDDILQGCREANVTLIHDRKSAIRRAVINAQAGECVVVAGKGHEQYQERQGQRQFFDDSEVVEQALTDWRAA